MSLDSLLSVIIQNENVIGYGILFVSSIIEYIFPPFPGDTVTLFGAFLVATRGWNFYWVFAAVTLGSVLGSTIDYILGYRIKKWNDSYGESNGKQSKKGKIFLTKKRYDFIKEKIDKYGPAYIILNRFMPGIRAFFFIAAGFAQMNFFIVVLFNLISVITWNFMIIYFGILIGSNWSKLLSIFKAYSEIVTVLIILLTVFLLIKFLIRRKAKQS